MDNPKDQFFGEEQSEELGSQELKAQIDAILENTLEDGEIPKNDSYIAFEERSVVEDVSQRLSSVVRYFAFHSSLIFFC